MITEYVFFRIVNHLKVIKSVLTTCTPDNIFFMINNCYSDLFSIILHILIDIQYYLGKNTALGHEAILWDTYSMIYG